MQLGNKDKVSLALALKAYRESFPCFLWPQLVAIALVALLHNSPFLLPALLVPLHAAKGAAADALDCRDTLTTPGPVFRFFSVLRYVLLNTLYLILILVIPIGALRGRIDWSADAAAPALLLGFLATAYFAVAWFRWPGFAKGVTLSWSADYWDNFNRARSTIREFQRIGELRAMPECTAAVQWLGSAAQTVCFLAIFIVAVLAALEYSFWLVLLAGSIAWLLLIPLACLVLVGNNELLSRAWAARNPDLAYQNTLDDLEERIQNNLEIIVERRRESLLPLERDLEDGGSPQSLNPAGVPLFLEAVANMRLDLIDGMVGRGADINLAHSDGRTALMFCGGVAPGHANAAKSLEIAEYFLAKGADPNTVNPGNGNTALHYCAVSDRTDLADLLIANGADPAIPDTEGRTPFELACYHGSMGYVKAILKRHPQSVLSDADVVVASLTLAYRRRRFDVFSYLLSLGRLRGVLATSDAAQQLLELTKQPLDMTHFRKVVAALGRNLLEELGGGRWQGLDEAGELSPWSDFAKAPDAIVAAAASFMHPQLAQIPICYWSEQDQHVLLMGAPESSWVDVIRVPKGWSIHSRIEIGSDHRYAGLKEFLDAANRKVINPPQELKRKLKALGTS